MIIILSKDKVKFIPETDDEQAEVNPEATQLEIKIKSNEIIFRDKRNG
jgi:hypothetical protein